MTKKNIIICLFAIVLIVFIAIYVWPTRYRYDHTNIKGLGLQPVRINRFNGETETLYPNGWRKLHSESENQITKELPDVSVIDGRAGIEGNRFVANIYNGSRWKLEAIDVEINISNMSRRYRLTNYFAIEPYSSGNLYAYLDSDFLAEYKENSQQPDWNILSAKGYPSPEYVDILDKYLDEDTSKQHAKTKRIKIYITICLVFFIACIVFILQKQCRKRILDKSTNTHETE